MQTNQRRTIINQHFGLTKEVLSASKGARRDKLTAVVGRFTAVVGSCGK